MNKRSRVDGQKIKSKLIPIKVLFLDTENEIELDCKGQKL